MRHVIPSFFLLSVFLNLSSAQAAELNFNKENKPISLIGLTEKPKPHDGCLGHKDKFIVDEVAYDGISEIIGGIRVKDPTKPTEPPKLLRMDTSSLSNLDKSWLPYLVQKGNILNVYYNVCGNGSFHYVRDIILSNQ